MIGKRGKLLVVLYVVFLAVLFLMCSTDLIIREPEKEIYQVAVIIEEERDDNYGNFRKGMDQAAMEFNADVRFITLYEKLNADEQMELIGREQQDGADALIVAPADGEQVMNALTKDQVTIPLVLLGAGEAGESATKNIMVDYKQMGQLLAQKMIEDMPDNCPVLALADSQMHSIRSRLFLEGAYEAFGNSKSSFQIVETAGEQEIRIFMEGLENWTGGQVAILAESPEILAEAAELLADSPILLKRIWGLYGRGSKIPILNYLDRGLVKGICVTDEFSIGYLSVSMAVEAAEKGAGKKVVAMDSVYIDKESLRDPVYEKLLFPIE